MTTVKRYLLISILNLKPKQMQHPAATPHLSTFNSELFVLKGLGCRMHFSEVDSNVWTIGDVRVLRNHFLRPWENGKMKPLYRGNSHLCEKLVCKAGSELAFICSHPADFYPKVAEVFMKRMIGICPAKVRAHVLFFIRNCIIYKKLGPGWRDFKNW